MAMMKISASFPHWIDAPGHMIIHKRRIESVGACSDFNGKSWVRSQEGHCRLREEEIHLLRRHHI